MKPQSRPIIQQSLIAVISTMTAASAYAQAPASTSRITGFEEIVVTAQKREQRLIDVPAAVTALAGGSLMEKGALRFEDYQAYVPGLSTVQISPGFNQITLRGVTSGSSQLSATTATYFDETPTISSSSVAFGSKLTPDPDLFDVARIEILRGPQGTLYGANALGGVIRYILAEPDLYEWQGRAQAGVSSVAHGGMGYVARGAVGAPLVEGILGARASGFYTRDGGYIDNVSTGQDNVNRSTNWGGRLAFQLKPNEWLTADLSSLYQRRSNDGVPSETIDVATFEPLNGKYTQALPTEEFLHTRYQLHSLKLSADLDFATLVSATGYGRQKSSIAEDVSYQLGAFTGLPATSNRVGVDLKKFTQELRLVSPSGDFFEYIVGAFYTHEKSFATNDSLGFSALDVLVPPQLIDSDLESRYEEAAIFANVTLHFTDRFNLQAGGRWSRNWQGVTLIAGGAIFGPLAGTVLDENSAETAWTYAVSPQFKVTPDINLYARLAKGFRPGGANLVQPGSGDDPTYSSDTLLNYELGMKATALDRRLNFSIAAYNIDWQDIQTTGFSGLFFILLNGGKARIQGVEAEASWSVDGLTIGGNISYTDAKTRDPIPAVGAQVGDALPYVPEWSGAVTADYEFPVAAEMMATVGGGLRYTGSRHAYYSLPTASNPANIELDGNVLLDLRAGLRHGPYELSIFAQNITDKRAVTSVRTETANPFTGAGVRSTTARPRTIGLTLDVNF